MEEKKRLISHIIEPELHLWGEFFSPKLLQTIERIELGSKNELGEIMSRGRYKNRQAPYGSCQLLVPSYVDLNDRIIWMAEFIFMNKSKFEEAGATDIVFWIYWSGVQGNMSFTPRELKMIAKTNIPLCIDYITLDPNKLEE